MKNKRILSPEARLRANEASRLWCERHPEQRRQIVANWKAKNPEKIAQYSRTRDQEKKRAASRSYESRNKEKRAIATKARGRERSLLAAAMREILKKGDKHAEL